jgi:hypothetical protein
MDESCCWLRSPENAAPPRVRAQRTTEDFERPQSRDEARQPRRPGNCCSRWLDVMRRVSCPLPTIPWSCGTRIEHWGMLVAADIVILTAMRIRCLRTNGCENRAIYSSCGEVAGNRAPNVSVPAGEVQRLALMGIIDCSEWKPTAAQVRSKTFWGIRLRLSGLRSAS